MIPLNERKQRILKAIVQEHVDTAEPVGSEALVSHYAFGVRSATIRNEMAEMSEMGYLRQPHTSAGRVPSDLGYRFYVDRLMDAAVLPGREAVRARKNLAVRATVVDQVISHSCRILTGLTRYTAVATQPSTRDAFIQHLNLSRLTGRKLLMIVVLSDGRVEHRLLNPERQFADGEVRHTGHLLAARFVGREVGKVGGENVEPITDLGRQALAMLRQVAEDLSLLEVDVWIEGANHILTQPEFKDPAKLGNLMAVLEERRRLYQLLSRVVLGPDVTIVIGSENPYREMQDTSFVAAKYKIGERVAGTIGVVGPTRMDYGRAVAAVDVMARNLSELLTQLSVA